VDEELRYRLRHEARELAEADRLDELRAVLLDLDRMRRKISEFGYPAVDEDLGLLPSDRTVTALRTALRGAASRLEPLRPANALKVTLLSVLPGPVRSAVLAATSPQSRTPRLEPVQDRLLATVIPGRRPPSALIGFPDGRRLLRCDDDGLVEVFDVELGELVALLRRLPGPVTDAAVSAGSRHVLAADAVGSLVRWTLDESSGLPVGSVEAVTRPAAVRCAFLPDGRVVTVPIDGRPTVRDGELRVAGVLDELPYSPGRVELGPLLVSPAGRWLAVQGRGRAGFGAYVWDLVSGRLVHHRPDLGILGPHDDGGLVVAHRGDIVSWEPLSDVIGGLIGRGWLRRRFGRRSTRIAQSAADPGGRWLCRVDQTDRTRGEAVTQFATVRLRDRTERRLHVAGEVGALVTEPGGAWLAVGTDGGYADGEVHLWRPGREPVHLGRHDGPVIIGTAGGQGAWLATGDRHGTVRLWPAGATTTGPPAELERAMTRCAARAGWFVAVDTDRTAYVVSTASGEVRHRLASRERVTFINGLVFTCAAGQDGRWLATADDDGTVYYWDPVSGRRIRTATGHREQVVASDAADRLVTVDRSGLVIIGSPSGGDRRFTVDPAGGRPLCRIDPAGRWTAVTGGADLHFAGSHRVRFRDRLTALETTGGGLLAGDESGAVHLVDPAGAGPSLIHRADGPVGHLVAGNGWTACVLTARIDIVRAGGVRTIDRDVEPVTAAAASPDGRLLATVSGVGTLRIWDPVAGRPVTGLRAAAGLLDVCWPAADSVCAVGPAGVARYRLVS
jgi:WD40 repeat protein